MPIDLKSIITGGADVLSSQSTAGKFLKSTLGLAILITLVIILIVMFVYPAKEDAGAKALLQIFVYGFMVNVIMIFFHDSMIKSDLKREHRNEVREEIVGDAMRSSAQSINEPMQQTIPLQQTIPMQQSIPQIPVISQPTYIPVAPQIPTTDEESKTGGFKWGGSKWGGKPIGPHLRIG